MGLFGPSKPKFEESAQIAEKIWAEIENELPEDTKTRRAIFSGARESSAYFTGLREGFVREAKKMIVGLRATRDKEEASWILMRLSEVWIIVYLTSIMDSVSEAMFRQHGLVLDLADAVSERNDQKIAQVAKALKEQVLPLVPNETQKHILDLIEKEWGDIWGGLKDGK